MRPVHGPCLVPWSVWLLHVLCNPIAERYANRVGEHELLRLAVEVVTGLLILFDRGLGHELIELLGVGTGVEVALLFGGFVPVEEAPHVGRVGREDLVERYGVSVVFHHQTTSNCRPPVSSRIWSI